KLLEGGNRERMSGANASATARSHQEMSGANASATARSHQEMSGANASATARSHQEWTPLLLEAMPEMEAGELVGALLPVDSPLSEDQKLGITREAGGSPFVLEQLARYAGVTSMGPSRAPTFAEMFATRLTALPVEARRFLETLAICGRPMEPDL